MDHDLQFNMQLFLFLFEIITLFYLYLLVKIVKFGMLLVYIKEKSIHYEKSIIRFAG